MSKETIIVDGMRFNRNSEAVNKCHREYFWAHPKWKQSPISLHRYLWIKAYGPIPKGFVVHHKNDDRSNNELNNFELLPRLVHDKLSANKCTTPEFKQQCRERSLKLWESQDYKDKHQTIYKTDEWKRQLSRNAKKHWDTVEFRTLKCKECLKEFNTRHQGRVEFCGDICWQRFRRKSDEYREKINWHRDYRKKKSKGTSL